VTGTLGVLEEAARRGLLNLPDALARLQQTSFRASPTLLRLLLERDAERKSRQRTDEATQ
jgi:predicted nucleic acid-binding protein